MIYYVSDTHWGHDNIRKYCSRPHSDIYTMNEALIANWNERVTPEDTIYHLGDFGMGSIEKLQAILDRLQGKKHLIIGNHDKTGVKLRGWDSIQHYIEIYDGSQKLVLFHYGIASFNQQHRGAIHLHGHSHGRLPGHNQRCDVGVDCWDFRPVTLSEIKRRLANSPQMVYEDHHRPSEMSE